jgi:hypothetical protein
MTVMPLVQELRLTISDKAQAAEEIHRPLRTYGREDERDTVARLLEQQRHLLLIGEHGIGKSHLLEYARDRLAAPDTTIYLDSFKTMRPTLQRVAQMLHEHDQLVRFRDIPSDKVPRKLARWQIADLTTLVCDSLHGHDYTFIIDDIHTITPTGVTVLQELTQVATVLGAASTDSLERLDLVVGRFNRLELGPLPSDAIKSMLWSYIDYDETPNARMLERKAIDTAKGNPGAIADVVTRYKNGEISQEEIRGLEHSGSQLDLTWTLFIAFAVFMAFRYVSRAMDSTTAYIAAGALSAFSLAARALMWRVRA